MPLPVDDPVIEPGIRPACDALNAREGIRTLWSCEGHCGKPNKPFVIFEATHATAFDLDRLLSAAYDDGRVRFWWNISANFREDGSLQYHMTPNDYRMEQNWRYLPGIRKQIDRELRRLAQLIS